MKKIKESENWQKYCPHPDCPKYKGKGIKCGWKGQCCEIHAEKQGLFGYYEEDESDWYLKLKERKVLNERFQIFNI